MLYIGDVKDRIKEISSESIQTIVTSPPYWGLRDYGTGKWEGGDRHDCSHRRDSKQSDKTITGHKKFDEMNGVGDAIYKTVCKKCGAIRVDQQLGLEEHPEEYVSNFIELARQFKRVLRKDGTFWLNLGDTYFGAKGGHWSSDNSFTNDTTGTKYRENRKAPPPHPYLKTKDLVGIPWRVAFGLQEDGWYLRNDIIWHKPNPMPEAVKDRCAKSHEYIFMLSKSRKYYFDYKSILEPSTLSLNPCEFTEYEEGVVRKDVWTLNTSSYKGAHFAVFPDTIPKLCILAGSREDDYILDPFMGSGTTAVMAQRLNRNWVGIELNPKYAEIINSRTSQMDLFYNNTKNKGD